MITDDDLFICGQCHGNFTNINQFLTHRATCIIEQSSLLSPPDLDEIIKNVSTTSELLNENSSNGFDLLFSSPVGQVTVNPESINKNVKLECPVCDEQFESETILQNHIFKHSIWNINSSDNSTLNIHMFNPIFRCLNETCSQLFDKPIDYIHHARIHNQKRLRRHKRSYRCRICEKLFLTNDQLQYHLNHDKHNFFCQICSAVFESNNSYHNHLAQHGEMIPIYRCTVCIESFEKRTDLSEHVITKHNADLPKQKSCTSCKLTFKTRFHLNRHNITKHSDVKPFKCEQDGCEQTFARKDKLKQHAAKHSTAGGIFKCHACEKSFIRPEHLRDHDIVRHSREFPLYCEYCRKGFLHQNQLYTHHKQSHSRKT